MLIFRIYLNEILQANWFISLNFSQLFADKENRKGAKAGHGLTLDPMGGLYY